MGIRFRFLRWKVVIMCEKDCKKDTDPHQAPPNKDAEEPAAPEVESSASRTDLPAEDVAAEEAVESSASRTDLSAEDVAAEEEGESSASRTDELAEVNRTLGELRSLFEQQIARNRNQGRMFDATYREMKEYKENTLLEAHHKPVIRDLIRFYDNLKQIESQLGHILDGMEEVRPGGLSRFRQNLENACFEFEEVLYRLDVTPYEERLETWDRKLHKTIEVKPAETPEQDRKVAEVHKTGFYWRDKVFRPEEVTIFRYGNKKGEKTNG